MKIHTLTVAMIQMACQLGVREGNLSTATKYIEQASRQGAKLVLLPEMLPGGYTLSTAIWETAEPFDGPSMQWMRALSKRLREPTQKMLYENQRRWQYRRCTSTHSSELPPATAELKR